MSDADKGARSRAALWRVLRERARRMRREPTDAEARLWERLRDRRLLGRKFRLQHAVGPYIVDFYCAQAELAVEIDGAIHLSSGEQDAARQQYLEGSGVRVLRFTNEQVEADLAGVLKKIALVMR